MPCTLLRSLTRIAELTDASGRAATVLGHDALGTVAERTRKTTRLAVAPEMREGIQPLPMRRKAEHTTEDVSMNPIDGIRAELGSLLAMLLPSDARAATLEVTERQVALRLYMNGPCGLVLWEELDGEFTPLVRRLLPSTDGPWTVIVQTSRRDRPTALDVLGTPVWTERGAVIATIDGHVIGAPEAQVSPRDAESEIHHTG
jgi:hypothetical protein